MGYGNGGAVVSQSFSSSVAGVAVSANPHRPAVITLQMDVLGTRTDALADLVAELAVRISAVLMSEPPDEAKPAAGVSIYPAVALGASLAQVNERLSHAAQRLRTILDRVEL